MVTDLKSVGCHSPRGSNPLLSASLYIGRLPLREAAHRLNDTILSLTDTGFFADMHYSKETDIKQTDMIKFKHSEKKARLPGLKRIAISIILILIFAMPAFAVFSSKGQIPNGAPVEYRGLKVTSEGVNISLVNKGEAPVKFSAACSFVGDNRKEIGDIFIEEILLAPGEDKQFKGLYFKGDLKLAKKAASLKWTIYTLEQ